MLIYVVMLELFVIWMLSVCLFLFGFVTYSYICDQPLCVCASSKENNRVDNQLTCQSQRLYCCQSGCIPLSLVHVNLLIRCGPACETCLVQLCRTTMLAQRKSSGFLTSVLVSSSPYSQPDCSGLCSASKRVTPCYAESVVNNRVQSRVILYP